MTEKGITVLSLFDGISCGRVALQRAGIQVDKYYASEIDKYAIKVAMKNYPDTIQIGDVTKVDGKQFEGIDLLIGGSPCQGFSFAGKQLNFDDPRSKLFFEYVHILNEAKPKYFLLENVKMKKEYQDIISQYLGVEPVEINSALVSAQNRARLYWTNIPVLSKPVDKHLFLKDVFNPDSVHREIKINHPETIRFTENYAQYDQHLKGHGSQDQRFYYMDGKSGTLLVSSSSIPKVKYGGKCWLFTPTECEALQTLPSCYTQVDGVSNAQRYKSIGNGWTVDVISHIFSYLPQEWKVK